MVKSALKILWRQCSLLACANIISSTSVGLRPQPREGVDQVVDLVVGQRQAEARVLAVSSARAAAAQHVDVLQRLRRQLVEQVRARRRATAQHALGHAVVQQRGDGRAAASASSALLAAEQAAS